MTTPPLDLPALRDHALLSKKKACACHPSMSVHPDTVLQLLDRMEVWEDRAGEAVAKYLDADARAEAAEAKVAAVRELAHPDWCLSVPTSVKQAILARIGGTA